MIYFGMKFELHDLGSDKFENLAYQIFFFLLGEGVNVYPKNTKDEGIDIYFEGVANCFVSENELWKGKVVVQVKHTSGYNRSYSDPAFFNDKGNTSTISKEIQKIKKLFEDGRLDYYILISNRTLTTITENKIKLLISKQAGVSIEKIYLMGNDYIEHFLREHPNVYEKAVGNPFEIPWTPKPEDLAELIECLASVLPKEVDMQEPVERVGIQDKNKKNNVTEEYFGLIRKSIAKYSSFFESFLANPNNLKSQGLYNIIVDEYQAKLFQSQKIMPIQDYIESLHSVLIERDIILKKQKILLRILLHYMYWNCDLGRK